MVSRGTAVVLGDSSRGRVHYDGGNELCTDSKYNDPGKDRIGSEVTVEGGGGGALSFDGLLNPLDPNGTRIELGFIAVTQNEYVRGDKTNFSAMLKLYMRDERIPEVNGNADPKYLPMVVMYCGDTKGHPALELHPSIANALRQIVGSSGGGTGLEFLPRMISPNQRFIVQIQNDGHICQYDTLHPKFPRPESVVWSNWYGMLRPLPW